MGDLAAVVVVSGTEEQPRYLIIDGHGNQAMIPATDGARSKICNRITQTCKITPGALINHIQVL